MNVPRKALAAAGKSMLLVFYIKALAYVPCLLLKDSKLP